MSPRVVQGPLLKGGAITTQRHQGLTAVTGQGPAGYGGQPGYAPDDLPFPQMEVGAGVGYPGERWLPHRGGRLSITCDNPDCMVLPARGGEAFRSFIHLDRVHLQGWCRVCGQGWNVSVRERAQESSLTGVWAKVSKVFSTRGLNPPDPQRFPYLVVQGVSAEGSTH